MKLIETIKILNACSKTACLAKWYNSTLWLGHGQTSSCYHPDWHDIDIDEIKDKPSALHNTQHKKQMRELMLQGKRPSECSYCWTMEDLGQLSDRHFMSQAFTKEDAEVAFNSSHTIDVIPKYLEVSFERTCNFACSYCNSMISSSWARDIKNNGPYIDTEERYETTGDWTQQYKADENPYIKAFWRWWDEELKNELYVLRVTGGEPLVSSSFWKLVDKFKADKPSCKLIVNTNLVPVKNEIERLIKESYEVDYLAVYTSNESTAGHSEYIRDGMNYDTWKQNYELILSESNIQFINNMATINLLCLDTLPQFIEEIIELRSKYNKRSSITLSVMEEPMFQSMMILPKEFREIYKRKLYNFRVKNQKYLEHQEYNQISRIEDYLGNIDELSKGIDIEKERKRFKAFFTQYDKRRNKSFENTFSKEIVDWYKSL